MMKFLFRKYELQTYLFMLTKFVLTRIVVSSDLVRGKIYDFFIFVHKSKMAAMLFSPNLATSWSGTILCLCVCMCPRL